MLHLGISLDPLGSTVISYHSQIMPKKKGSNQHNIKISLFHTFCNLVIELAHLKKSQEIVCGDKPIFFFSFCFHWARVIAEYICLISDWGIYSHARMAARNTKRCHCWVMFYGLWTCSHSHMWWNHSCWPFGSSESTLARVCSDRFPRSGPHRGPAPHANSDNI